MAVKYETAYVNEMTCKPKFILLNLCLFMCIYKTNTFNLRKPSKICILKDRVVKKQKHLFCNF